MDGSVKDDSASVLAGFHRERRSGSLLADAHRRAHQYLQGLDTMPPWPDARSRDALSGFREPLPEGPTDGAELLGQLDRLGSPATCASNGGRWFGFVNGGTIPAALAARWLSDAWDQNVPMYQSSPVASELEAVCEGWLVELFGLPSGTKAGFVTGTSTATLCGLAAARGQILERAGWPIRERGLFGAPALRIVMSDQTHVTVNKALSVLGFGSDQCVRVRSDAQGRLDPSALPALDGRTILLLQAGNVNTGSFDDFNALCGPARRAGSWVHVDGAFGLWALACGASRALCAGVQQADSWSVDAHKTLNAPYDCGIVLCRHEDALHSAMGLQADYLTNQAPRDGMHLTLDMSRRARAVDLWATLKALGRSGADELVAHLMQQATRFARGLRMAGFQMLNEVVFNQVLVAADDATTTRDVLARVQSSGECWCGGTQWNGAPAIRISVCGWATTGADIDRSVTAFTRALDEARAGRD